MNAAALFNTRERHDPSALALRWDGGSMSYGDLGTQARRAAAALAARGVGVNDRVALLLPNDPKFAVALLGTLWLGATAAVLSPVWRGHDALQALLDADVRALVTTQARGAGRPALPHPARGRPNRLRIVHARPGRSTSRPGIAATFARGRRPGDDPVLVRHHW